MSPAIVRRQRRFQRIRWETGHVSTSQSNANPSRASRPDSFFEAVGGHATFEKLVRVFYEGVAEDPIMREMYPEEDLGPAAERLQLFLEQYWGGPTMYSDTRGHPRIRMRHVPYSIDSDARDRWLKHMLARVKTLELALVLEATLCDYL